jgi:hypothetical protein
MKIDVIRDEKNPSNEYLYEKDANTGEGRLRQVPIGTSKGYAARVINLNQMRGVATAAYEELYDIRKKVYNVRTMSGTDLMTFRPIHGQELKTSLANMHESDPYARRITGFYTDYTFGDEIRNELVPVDNEVPKSRKEVDDMVRKIISKTEHKDFMKFVAIINHMSDIYGHMKMTWHQAYVFGMAASWKSFSIRELVSVKQKLRIPIHSPIKIKPIDGFFLTNIHQDVDTMDPKYFEYINPNATVNIVKDVNKEDVEELSLRPNTKLRNQSNMLPWERLIVVKRPNIGTTPNTSVYGVSPLLPVLYISENIRRIDEKILPELNEGSYAGVGIFTVKEDSKYDIDKLAQDLSTAGTRIVLNEGVEYQDIKVDFNMEGIINQKISLIKSELLALGVPESIFFPADTNRSVLEILINVWQNVDLNKERELLQNVMWNYWYRDLMKIFFPGEEYLDLSLTMRLRFKNKTFAGFIDKAAPTLEAYKYGLMPKAEAREMLDQDPISEYEDEEEDMPIIMIEKEKQKAVGENRSQSGFGAGTGGGTSAGTGSQSSPATRDKISSATKVTNSTSRSRGGTD